MPQRLPGRHNQLPGAGVGDTVYGHGAPLGVLEHDGGLGQAVRVDGAVEAHSQNRTDLDIVRAVGWVAAKHLQLLVGQRCAESPGLVIGRVLPADVMDAADAAAQTDRIRPARLEALVRPEEQAVGRALEDQVALALLNPLRQRDLLIRRQQRHTPDVLEVHAYRVVDRHVIEVGQLVAVAVVSILGDVALVIIHNADAGLRNQPVDLLNVLSLEVLDVAERLLDVPVGEHPLFASECDQRLDFIHLLRVEVLPLYQYPSAPFIIRQRLFVGLSGGRSADIRGRRPVVICACSPAGLIAA